MLDRPGTGLLGTGLLGTGLLGERAALAGLSRRAPCSVGGAFRALRAADGWLGLSLARPDDIALLPALTGGRATCPACARLPAAGPEPVARGSGRGRLAGGLGLASRA